MEEKKIVDKTAEVLKSMLKENVGRSLCDSGGSPNYDESGKYVGSSHGYGRHFERNAGRDFEKEEQSVLSFRIYGDDRVEIDLTHNIYHWLKSRVDYHVDLNELFDKFAEKECNEKKGWFELVGEFLESSDLKDVKYEDGEEVMYGESEGVHGFDLRAYNTCNEQNLLSQDFWYCPFKNESGTFVFVASHNGCDLRGGYAKPVIFDFSLDERSIFDHGRGSIYCTGKDHHESLSGLKEAQEKQGVIPGVKIGYIDFDCNSWWDTDDGGYSFRGEDSWKDKFNEMEVIDLEEEGAIWESGKLCVKDGVGYCPKCGAKLAGGFNG